MPRLNQPVEKPRKQPVQTRSAATVDAILQATIQVLVGTGKERLTTTLVAQRAGVSVGTLYQYFPNKRSLLQAVLRQHLSLVTETFEAACEAHHDRPVCEMITAAANAFFHAKMRNPKMSLALYSVSSDVDGLGITEDLRLRTVEAFERALASAPEELAIERSFVAFTLQAAMIGVSRRILESGIPAREHEALREQMVVMLCAYAKNVVRQPMLPAHALGGQASVVRV